MSNEGKREIIIARVTGGLGNQMFQYATALAVAEQAHAELGIDTSCYDYTHESNRRFMLDRFNISAPVVTPNRFSRFLYKLAGAERPGVKLAAPFIRNLLGICDLHEDQPYRFTPIQRPDRTRIRLMGYWQSPRYFEDHADEIRRQFTLKHPPQGRNQSFLQQIQACPCPVSLHVRRGDYLTARPQAVLPLDYYRRAIDIVLGEYPQAVFFVFSDDIPWAMSHLNLPQGSVGVDANDELSAEQDLRLMSACRHHIIANSSFSWWGAWLNPNPFKLVIAPKYWMGTPDSHYPDLHPQGWRIIDNVEP